MACTDCHDAHRSAPPVNAAKKTSDRCTACHIREGAARLFPHEAGRGDGCVVCHEPHGTSHPRLLKFPRVLDLCLSCHVPPPGHDLGPGSAFANCLACHTEIHGSDANRHFFR